MTSALLLTGSDACDGAPWMSAVAACQQASTGGVLYQLCVRMLGTSPEAKEVTGYVVTAMNTNRELFAITEGAADKVRQDPSASEEMKTACGICMGKYDKSEVLMFGVKEHLRSCELTMDIRMDLATAAAAVDDCATLLLRAGGDQTPLHRMVLLDRDRAVLALRLAILLVPNKLQE
ncbi:hypothetical protein E2562_038317 [Oryza meyeriana var. granulata]|uniref:Pectinesterase inhibitor domain-containing protein n=1 Tax=Oryza meyeriana var. granulata TaxID=110450 RepID=A0A6G1CN23_9ORYZ|nr:hypothetical protein E2562_038317 [Oryza meyeriana var. granulata]